MKELPKSGFRRIGGGPSGTTSPAGRNEGTAPVVERSRLLYVEDNRDNWEVTELMLRRRFDLRWARTDEEACNALNDPNENFSAVLMDIELQGSNLSGIDLTKLLRGTLPRDNVPEYAKKVVPRPDFPIIFVTGYSARYSEDDLIAVGGSRGLTKPVNFGALSMALSSLAVEKPAAPAQPGRRQLFADETRIAHLLVDNPRFHVHLRELAEGGLFAPRGYTGDLGALATMLGKQGVDAAAIAISVLEIVRNHSGATRYLTSLVFRRAVACALIAQRTALADVYWATAVGFLMDAGFLVRAIHDANGALEIGMAPAESRLSRERAGDEVEHPQRILDVARAWDVPVDVVEAVKHHHDVEAPNEPLSRIAWAAEKLAAVFETGDIVANNSAALASARAIGLMSKDIEGLLDELPGRVKLLSDTTSVDIPAQTQYRTLLEQATPPLAMMARAYRELEVSAGALVAEKHGLAERLAKANEDIAASHRKDLALIAAVQEMFLPAESRITSGRVQLSAFYRAADDCGGDWWWFDEDKERVRVFVGDVSGHGAGSAMVTGSIASACRLVRSLHPKLPVPELLALLHKELLSMARGEYHMTMLVLEMARGEEVMNLFTAAAPHVLVMQPDGKIAAAVARGTPLGLPSEFTIGRVQVPVPNGTRIMCFTDGVYEFRTKGGQELGIKSLRQMLGNTKAIGLDEALKKVVREVDAQHPLDVPQEDDMTMVMLDIKG